MVVDLNLKQFIQVFICIFVFNLFKKKSSAAYKMNFCIVSKFLPDDDGELRIVLVGRTGAGKSSTGNSILLQEDAFERGCFGSSVTVDSTYKKGEVLGRKVVVVDTPGLFDTKRPNNEVLKDIAKVVLLSAPGAHAIVLVMTAQRLTPEYQKTLDLLIGLFETKVYK